MPDQTFSATPVSLLRLSRAEAQARTTIAQRAIGLPLRLGSTQWQARLVPVIAPEPLLDSSAGTWLHFEWAGAVLALHLPQAAIEQVLAAGLDHALLPELPPELLQSVLEAGLADVLQALQTLGRGVPQRTPFSDPGTVPAHAFDVLLRSVDGPEAVAARLHADGLGVLLLAGLLAQRAPQLRPTSDAVPVLLRAELGCTRVSLDELQALALGDVVLVDTSFMGAQRTLWLSADGQAGLHVQLPATPAAPPLQDAEDANGATAPAAPATPDFLTVLHPWSSLMPAPIPQDSADGATAAALQALPVRLSFDLGEVSLTLAQLQALQPGQTLALGHPLAGAVRIRANGALLGEGDLVEIDGQLGVSVRTLFGSSTA